MLPSLLRPPSGTEVSSAFKLSCFVGEGGGWRASKGGRGGVGGLEGKETGGRQGAQSTEGEEDTNCQYIRFVFGENSI